MVVNREKSVPNIPIHLIVVSNVDDALIAKSPRLWCFPAVACVTIVVVASRLMITSTRIARTHSSITAPDVALCLASTFPPSNIFLKRPLISSLPRTFEKFLTPAHRLGRGSGGVIVTQLCRGLGSRHHQSESRARMFLRCPGLRVARPVVLRVSPPRGHGHSGCELDCAGRYCRGEGAWGAAQRPAFP
ncbi:hypothetical protein B0H11DRAFT_1929296 [Mycena galericulata]|nr:hypothetical protein B0H11DRAFT_1929296 [Mycena galericulata]